MLIKRKLIIALFVLTGITSLFGQEIFDKKNAFISMLKLTGSDINIYLDEYLFRFENNSYRRYNEDEFEARRVCEDLYTAVSETEDEIVYCIEFESEFGIYNFVENKFNFQPFDATTTLKIVDFLFAPRFKTNTEIKLKFLNGEEISGLPMGFDKANFLVKMRKNTKTGKVDRRIYLKVYFVLDPIIDFSESNTGRNDVIMYGNITNIEAYDNIEHANDPLVTLVTKYEILRQNEKELSSKIEEGGD